MTVTFDLPNLDPATQARWETQLPLFAEKWAVGRIGGVMLGERTYYLQRTGVDTLRLVEDRETLALVAPVKVDALAALYRELWGALFQAASLPPEQQALVLAEVERRLPSSCGCLSAWNSWKREHPPAFGNGFFAWLWEAKREVRTRQRKPSLTLAEALALYASVQETFSALGSD